MDSPSVKVLKETNNAVSMEVVLAEASTPKRPNLDSSDVGKSPVVLTATDIKRKLESAAERRRSFTQERQQSVAAQIAKHEDVLAKRAALNDEFVQTTKLALEQKLEKIGENREAYLKQLKERVKEKLEKHQELHQTKENDELEESKQLMAEIEKKMGNASANRDEQLGAVIKRVQEHQENVVKVNANYKKQLETLKKNIDLQLTEAEERRNKSLQKIVETAKVVEKKVEMARQKKNSMVGGNTSVVNDENMELE